MTDEEFRDDRRSSPCASSRAARPTRRCSPSSSPDVRYVAGSFDEDAVYEALHARARRARRRGRAVAEPLLLPLDGADVLSRHRRRPRPPRPRRSRRRRGAGDHREAVRPLAGGGARPQRARAVGLRRGPGLPHRPLPRQGDRPERPGAALRQQHVRAAVEPQLHRPRADHGLRGHRDRLARGLLRLRRRAARPRPEPHAAAALAAVHGAAGRLRGRPGARREGQGAARDQRADAGRDPGHGGARPVRGRDRRPARRCPATSRRPACPRTRRPRRTRRCAWRSTTGAGPACRCTCAPASAWRAR